MKPQVVKQAETESGADDGAPESTATAKRKAVSKRSFLDKSGAEADSMNDATGGRYTLLNPEGNVDFDYQFGVDPELDRACAIFGFHTKVGNVANTVLNDKDEPGSPADAAEMIRDFLAKAKTGVWAERTGGGGESRIDKDALAGAIVAVARPRSRWPICSKRSAALQGLGVSREAGPFTLRLPYPRYPPPSGGLGSFFFTRSGDCTNFEKPYAPKTYLSPVNRI
jgi:hypothetical protein